MSFRNAFGEIECSECGSIDICEDVEATVRRKLRNPPEDGKSTYLDMGTIVIETDAYAAYYCEKCKGTFCHSNQKAIEEAQGE